MSESHKGVRYISLPNSFDSNAERHLRRATWHMMLGKYDYAMGSISKAVRNFNRANQFRRPFNTRYRLAGCQINGSDV